MARDDRKTDLESSIARVEEFLRQHGNSKDRGDHVYGIHTDPAAEMAVLYASDLRAIVQTLRLVESMAKAAR